MPVSRIYPTIVGCCAVLGIFGAHQELAADSPPWMHAQLNGALPAHDEKTDAVVLFAETTLTVQANGKIRRLYRAVVKILRPDGDARATIRVYFDAQTRITDLHARCIPVSGKA